MPLDPSPLEGVHPHVKAEITDDGQISIWVKDKHHVMAPSEAIAFARQVMSRATQADSVAQSRADAKDQ